MLKEKEAYFYNHYDLHWCTIFMTINNLILSEKINTDL